MKTENSSGGLFRKIRSKMSGKQVESETGNESRPEDGSHQMMEEFEAVKRNPRSVDGLGL